MSLKAISGSVGIVGVIVVIVAAIVGWAVLPNVIDNRIKEEVRLVSGTETWDKWANITLPIKLKFHIFHVNNPLDVEQHKAKPNLTEFGPYVYDQHRVKFDLEEKSDLVFFRQKTTYIFNRNESRGDDTDRFDVINPALLSVMNGLRVNEAMFGIVVGHLHSQGERIILRNVSVRELTFEGYDVSAYNDYPLISANLPHQFDDRKFGLYDGKNGSDDGLFLINSGKGSNFRFGEIVEWEHQSTLDYWNLNGSTTTCGIINGTDGSIFPPFVEKDRILQVFITDLCRSLHLTYSGETEIRGIKGYEFSLPADALEDPRKNPRNRCFCPKENITECYYSGVLDVSRCRNGAPVVMSTPHFLGGDQTYINDTGLSPNQTTHSTVLVVEPTSGVLLEARKRIQVNFRLEPFQETRSGLFSNVTDVIFPILWVEETMLISESSASDLEDKLLKPIKTVNVARWTVVGVGIFLTICGGGLYLLIRNRSMQTV